MWWVVIRSAVFELRNLTLLEVLLLKINMNSWKRLLPIAVGLFVLPLFAQSAQATAIDFACGGSLSPILPCVLGTISTSYSNPSTLTSAKTTTGVIVDNTQGPDLGQFFQLTFDTGTSNISLVEIGGDGSILTGTIQSFGGLQGGSEDSVNLVVNWSAMPADDFQAFLGTPTGQGITTSVSLTLGGAADSATVSIQQTPEPSSLLLLGSGLLSFGGLLRRRIIGS
jgi:hypothetical protein